MDKHSVYIACRCIGSATLQSNKMIKLKSIQCSDQRSEGDNCDIFSTPSRS